MTRSSRAWCEREEEPKQQRTETAILSGSGTGSVGRFGEESEELYFFFHFSGVISCSFPCSYCTSANCELKETNNAKGLEDANEWFDLKEYQKKNANCVWVEHSWRICTFGF